VKKSRCGFAVVKLRIDRDDYFLMRSDPYWKDLNFIGGHERARDRGSLKNVARRESREEVRALRELKSAGLEALTEELIYGPVYSPSAKGDVEYAVRFFLLRFEESPEALVKALGPRTPNVLVRQEDLLSGKRHRISRLADLLDRSVPGGIRAVPYSWPKGLASPLGRGPKSGEGQSELAFG
jgi:hypothetical protein